VLFDEFPACRISKFTRSSFSAELQRLLINTTKIMNSKLDYYSGGETKE
jgi:hypothetical protein